MAKLDENYLSIVRKRLYHEENISKPNVSAPLKTNKPKNDFSGMCMSDSVSNKMCANEIVVSSKTNKARKVWFKDNTTEKEINTKKHRVSTPFKISAVVVINTTEKVSPSLSSDLEQEIPSKGQKRRLSLSDSPVVKKKTKQKHLGSRAKLNLDINLKNTESTGTKLREDQLCGKNKKKKNRRKKSINQTTRSSDIQTLDKSDDTSFTQPSLSSPEICDIVVNSNKTRNTGQSCKNPLNQFELNGCSDLNGSSTTIQKDVIKLSASQVNTKKKIQDKLKVKITSLDDNSDNSKLNGECDAAEFYDNDKLTVKNLKFLRFANLFQPILCEQYSGPSYFSVPKKHYKMSKSDQIEWQSEWIVSEAEKPALCNKIHATSTPILHQNPTNIEEYHPVTPSKSFEDSVRISNDNISDNIDEAVIENLLDPQKSSPTTSLPIVISLNDSSRVVVLTDMNQVVHFHGICYLKVLEGKIEILGAILDKNSVEQKMYSPRGTSLLYVRNYNKLYSENNIELKTLIPLELLDGDDINLSFAADSVILHCRELKEHYIHFIENSISQVIFTNNICTGPRVNFDLKGPWNKTKFSEQWEEALENLPDMFKLVVCGGKGVGKSTFLRYSINFLLRKFSKIRVIDLDPGQSEFYPPGFISVVTVDSFIFGPNYTHLQSADRLILSHINIGQNINQYLKSVKVLVDTTALMETLPTIINFHGFNLGIGLDISVNQMKLIKPTHVFEFRSKNQNKNFKFDMKAELINNFIKTGVLELDINTSESDELNYVYVKLASMAEKSEAWSLEARQSRELCLLAYFGKMMSDEVKDLTSPGVNMYSINISALTITNYEGRIISPLSINNNLVALCSLEQSNEIFSSYGYGLVRGLDLENDTLVVVTPQNIETLGNVTHLVLSAVTIPPDFVMTTGGAKGHIPYLNVGDLVDLGQLTKRSYIPAKK